MKHKKDFAEILQLAKKELPSANDQTRRAREKALPVDINFGKMYVLVYERFKGCALTHETLNIHIDHFVPVSIGHGGTIIENCIPLRADLNLSKSDNNPFEWYEAHKEDIDEDAWNELILYLAIHNDMTTEEFHEYVNWCFANKRTVEQCQKDQRRSAEIWKESRGLK